jgi:hypothetical protein
MRRRASGGRQLGRVHRDRPELATRNERVCGKGPNLGRPATHRVIAGDDSVGAAC